MQETSGRIALVHDWLTGMRGGEKILEVLCELYPDADLHTLVYLPGTVSERIRGMRVRTSFVQRFPRVARYYRHYLPFLPSAIESFDLKGYDLVISVSHCVAKGVIPPPGGRHLAYVLTPMRYIWDCYHDYFGPKAGRLVRIFMPFLANYLRAWDVSTSSRVDRFAAISRHVSSRVRRYYDREAEVIYPPVSTGRFSISESIDDYYLIVSALVPYKRVDLAVEAFTQSGRRLVVIGTGQESKRLKSMAGANIEFLGWQPDDVVARYYSRCRALIFPGEEDFGIVPLEAMASGRPVVAYARGGILETTVPLSEEPSSRAPAMDGAVLGPSSRPGREAVEDRAPASSRPSAVYFQEPEARALLEAVQRCEANLDQFDPRELRRQAEQFDRSVFKSRIRKFIHEFVDAPRSRSEIHQVHRHV